jgi:hypothetical protein
MESQSSVTVWPTTAAGLAVLEPKLRRHASGGGGGSIAKLTLVVSDVAIWMYIAALPAGLAL